MTQANPKENSRQLEILPEGVPVEMPQLPMSLTLTTTAQVKAFNEPIRTRIVNLLRVQPATAKQLAGRLGATPGSVGHHLKVLEDAGLVQVVALRVTRGIIARYYAAAARIFTYDNEFLTGLDNEVAVAVDILTKARDELTEALLDYKDAAENKCGFPHARISPERANYYQERVEALLDEFLQEANDPDGQVYGLSLAFFRAPAYLQGSLPASAEDEA